MNANDSPQWLIHFLKHLTLLCKAFSFFSQRDDSYTDLLTTTIAIFMEHAKVKNSQAVAVLTLSESVWNAVQKTGANNLQLAFYFTFTSD